MRIFIGSSSERRELVDFVTNFIREYNAALEPVPWTNYWEGGTGTLEKLLSLAGETDASILFWTPDDKTWYRHTERVEPRDNLVFEAGLFIAAHGPHRTQLLLPRYPAGDKRNQEVAAIPTDLLGRTLNSFNLAEGALTATGLPQALRNILSHLAALGRRTRPPEVFSRLKDRPGISEVTTYVGPFHEAITQSLPLLLTTTVRNVVLVVAYRLGTNIGGLLAPLRNQPGVNIRACFANMWDGSLFSCYQRKYHDRTQKHACRAIGDAIKELLGSGEISEGNGVVSLVDVGETAASYDIRLTDQRITYSYYRVDDVAFIVPLDMKMNREPPPQAWLLSKELAPAAFERYLSEINTVFNEAKSVTAGD